MGGRAGSKGEPPPFLLRSAALALPAEPECTADGPLPRRRAASPAPSPVSRNSLPSTSRHSGYYASRHMDTSSTRRLQQSKPERWLPTQLMPSSEAATAAPDYRITEFTAGVRGTGWGSQGGYVFFPFFPRPSWKPDSSTPWGSQTCRGSCTSAEARSWS